MLALANILPLLRRFWPALVIAPLLAALWWRGVQNDRLTDKLALAETRASICADSVNRLKAEGDARREAAARILDEAEANRQALADATAKLRANIGKDRGPGCEASEAARQAW